MQTHSQQPSFEILTANWRDLSALRTLEKACFPIDAWPLIDLIGVLSLPNVVRLKAITDARLVGFIAGDCRPSKDLAWIATIGVLPTHQRQGIAAALLTACEDQLEVSRIRLSVRQGNNPAISLYKSFGYQQVGIWPNYYQDKTDAIVFEKTCISTL